MNTRVSVATQTAFIEITSPAFDPQPFPDCAIPEIHTTNLTAPPPSPTPVMPTTKLCTCLPSLDHHCYPRQHPRLPYASFSEPSAASCPSPSTPLEEGEHPRASPRQPPPCYRRRCGHRSGVTIVASAWRQSPPRLRTLAASLGANFSRPHPRSHRDCHRYCYRCSVPRRCAPTTRCPCPRDVEKGLG